MSTLKGYNGSMTAGGGAVGEITSFTINQSADVQETSTLGSQYATNEATLLRWTASLEANFDIGDTGQDAIRTGLAAGTSVALEMFLGGTTGAGNASYTGSAVVESADVSNDVAGIVTYSISVTGTGQLTEAALA